MIDIFAFLFFVATIVYLVQVNRRLNKFYADVKKHPGDYHEFKSLLIRIKWGVPREW